EALTSWLEELDRKRLIDPGRERGRWSRVANDELWAPSAEGDPDEAAAQQWLRAVRNAAHDGYNVPLIWMPPCKKFRGGCGARELQTAGSGVNARAPANISQVGMKPRRLKPTPPVWLGIRTADVSA